MRMFLDRMTPSSIIVTPLLSRPKTTSGTLRNASLRHIYGKNCAYTLLGESKYLRFKDRPHSSTSIPGSSSSPTVPYSTADLLYSNGNRAGPTDDFAATDLVYYERDKDKHKLRELEVNKRPSSRNNTRRSISLEKVNFDGDKEELRPIKNTFPNAKQNCGRANGLRGTVLKSEQTFNHKNNVSLQMPVPSLSQSTRDSEDLVAMGTIWSPNAPQRILPTSTSTSSKSLSLTSSSTLNNYGPTRKGPSAASSRTSFPQYSSSNSRSTAKESEPKYTDPVIGAQPSFQQRMMELSALEAETVRWERGKKIKKKSKQDRDS